MIRFFSSAFLLLLLASISHATVMQKMDVDSLTHASDVVLLGKVISLRTEIDRNDTWTVATVIPERAFKGMVHQPINVRLPGGTRLMNGRVLVTKVEGIPEIELMQRAILFLQGSAANHFRLAGLNQGFWRVEIQAGREVVANGESIKKSAEPIVTLNELVRRVTQAAQSEKKP